MKHSTKRSFVECIPNNVTRSFIVFDSGVGEASILHMERLSQISCQIVQGNPNIMLEEELRALWGGGAEWIECMFVGHPWPYPQTLCYIKECWACYVGLSKIYRWLCSNPPLAILDNYNGSSWVSMKWCNGEIDPRFLSSSILIYFFNLFSLFYFLRWFMEICIGCGIPRSYFGGPQEWECIAW